MIDRIVGLGILVCMTGAAAAGAQSSHGVEFGMDAGLFHYSYSYSGGRAIASSSVLQFPVSRARVAFPMDGPFELEPALALTIANHASEVDGDLGLLVELNRAPETTQWFLRPAVGLIRFSASNTATSNRITLGAGLGVRRALTDRIAMRYEARYTYWTRSQNYTANVFGLLAGISVFTR